MWIITAPYGCRVKVTFTDFSTEFNADYVLVKDGGSATSTVVAFLFGRYTVQIMLTSTGTQMWIQFHSNGGVTFPGFKANYKAICPTTPPPTPAPEPTPAPPTGKS